MHAILTVNIRVICQKMLSILAIAALLLSSSLQAAKAAGPAAPKAAPWVNCATQSDIPEAECDALVSLYNNTTGASWTDHTDWLVEDTICTTWYGVTCTGGFVTGLSLPANNLNGTIPDLSALTSLQTLDLSGNASLTGNIPATLNSLTALTTLNLSNNSLSGSIPDLSALTSLTNLNLSSNTLSGSAPATLASLTALTTLLLNDNTGLTGSLPAGLMALSLVSFHFDNTDLCEPPDALFQTWLTTIVDLVSSGMQCFVDCTLQTDVPQAECEALQSLHTATTGASWTNHTDWLKVNSICTTWYGVTCLGGHVSQLNLPGNNLVGSIPDLSALTSLTALDLSGNTLNVGGIPATLNSLTALTTLNLSSSALTGSIPNLSALTSLTNLNLSGNALSGSIPGTLNSLTALTALNLSNNSLSGSIPDLSALTSLLTLNLSTNALSGSVPATLNSLTALTNLRLDNNAGLTGSLDSGLTALSLLASFHYDNTDLCAPPDVPFQTWLGTIADLVSTGVTCFDCTAADIPQAQCDALVSLYDDTTGASWTTATNWKVTNTVCGNWFGVTCGAGPVVTQVNLPGNNLVGSIPDLSALTSLTALDLSGNTLSGNIPATLNSLTALNSLNLSNNSLSGSIPNLSALTSLTNLNLSSNALTGSIPGTLNSLTALTALNLSNNSLSGSIPDLSALTSLLTLNLSTNALTGSAPATLASLTSLTTLRLNANAGLSGSLPAGLTSLALTSFHFDNTALCEPPDAPFQAWLGTIVDLVSTGVACFDCTATDIPQTECEALQSLYTSTAGASWTNDTDWLVTNTVCGNWFGVTCGAGPVVTQVNLPGNNLVGSIPDLSALTSLAALDLSGNTLSGNIPATLNSLTALNSLNLSNNSLSGSIPNLSALTSLTNLNLSSNALTGGIPNLSALTSLTTLNLSNTTLGGNIPATLNSLTALTSLLLNSSAFTGSIPDLSALTSLTTLNLASNSLTGSVPSTLTSLTSLTTLQINDNAGLSGSLPSGLTALSLASFHFNNTAICEPPDVPFQTWLGAIVDLARTGVFCFDCTATDLPQAECEALQSLYISTTGAGWTNDTDWLSNNTVCGNWFGVTCGAGPVVTQVNLPGNNLVGTIPDLSALTSLTDLDLSGNTLSGSIPDLSALTNLQTLDLSANVLSGSIPATLGSLTGLTSLQLDNNALTGSLPAQLANLTALTTLRINNNAGLSGSLPGGLTALAALNSFHFDVTGLCEPSDAPFLLWLAGIADMVGTGVLCDLCSVQSDVPQSECEALQALYNGTTGASWTDHTDWLTTNTVCTTWFGVTCAAGQVTQLNLPSNNLVGTLPTALGNLPALLTLDLSGNTLSGSLPSTLGSLSSLTTLRLANNTGLSGAIPSTLTSVALNEFSYNNTGVCEPADVGFQNWLISITTLNRNNKSCSVPAQTFTVSGTVTSNGQPLAGVTVSDDFGHSGVSLSDGTYIIRGMPNGSYFLRPNLGGYVFNPGMRTVSIQNANLTGQDFSATSRPQQSTNLTYSISGSVVDNYGNPMSGVTLTAGNAGSTVTDSSGNFSLNLPGGTYTLTPSLAGYTFSPASASVTTGVSQKQQEDGGIVPVVFRLPPEDLPRLNAKALQLSLSFTATYQGQTYSVTGTLTNSYGAAFGGVYIVANNGFRAMTASNGTYTINGFPPGSYTLTPALSGYTLNPGARYITISDVSLNGQDFTAVAPGDTQAASSPVITGVAVSGQVRDAAGLPLPGAIVYVGGYNAVSDANGFYVLVGLPSYQTVTLNIAKEGYVFSPAAATVTFGPGMPLAWQDFTGLPVGSIGALQPENPLAASQSETAAAPAGTHIVKRGENLFRIGLAYGINYHEIMKANGLNATLIYPGQTLVIPARGTTVTAPAASSVTAAASGAPTLYTVVLGDTLYSIAARYGTTWGAIMDANGLTSSIIYGGQELIIP